MNIPALRPFLAPALALVLATGLFAQTPAPKLEFPQPSPTATLKERVGLTDIEVVYSRPGLKGRTAFGGLLAPFGTVWRTGANNATRITFSTDVKVQGSPLAAGTYELFTIPGKTEWTVIFQKAAKHWGSYAYKPADDTLRITAKPRALAQPVETFLIEFSHFQTDSGVMSLLWENTLVPVKISMDVVGELVPRIEAAMAAEGDKKPYVEAAMFYLDNGLDLKKAAQWMDAAIAAQPGAFYFEYRKAKVLAAMGDKAGATATAQASIAAATKAGGELGAEYVRLNHELIASLK